MTRQVVLAITMVAMSTLAWAEIKPEDQIKFRQSGYTFMRWNIDILKNQLVDKPQSYDKAQVVAAANVIAAIANAGMDDLYSPQSASGKGWKQTRVKAEFFEQTDKVKTRSLAFKKAANTLVQVAASGDTATIKAQFLKLHKSCKACHDSFRTKN